MIVTILALKMNWSAILTKTSTSVEKTAGRIRTKFWDFDTKPTISRTLTNWSLYDKFFERSASKVLRNSRICTYAVKGQRTTPRTHTTKRGRGGEGNQAKIPLHVYHVFDRHTPILMPITIRAADEHKSSNSQNLPRSVLFSHLNHARVYRYRHLRKNSSNFHSAIHAN